MIDWKLLKILVCCVFVLHKRLFFTLKIFIQREKTCTSVEHPCVLTYCEKWCGALNWATMCGSTLPKNWNILRNEFNCTFTKLTSQNVEENWNQRSQKWLKNMCWFQDGSDHCTDNHNIHNKRIILIIMIQLSTSYLIEQWKHAYCNSFMSKTKLLSKPQMIRFSTSYLIGQWKHTACNSFMSKTKLLSKTQMIRFSTSYLIGQWKHTVSREWITGRMFSLFNQITREKSYHLCFWQ